MERSELETDLGVPWRTDLCVCGGEPKAERGGAARGGQQLRGTGGGPAGRTTWLGNFGQVSRSV